MSVPEEYEHVLRDLERSVIETWRKNPGMTDHVALRAYEAAYAHYRAEQRGHPAKPHGLTGIDGATFDALGAACERWLGRGAGSGGKASRIEPISAEEMVACLRRLIRSVKLHTERAGRQGYLNFVGPFLP
ncbi:MAG: hypothetical protein ACREH8_24085 [Opitutaceae bacterium]